MLIRRNIELQSLVNARTRALNNAEKKVVEQRKKILDLESKYLKSAQRNTELSNLFYKVKRLAESNKYGDADMFCRKIKELVADFEDDN